MVLYLNLPQTPLIYSFLLKELWTRKIACYSDAQDGLKTCVRDSLLLEMYFNLDLANMILVQVVTGSN